MLLLAAIALSALCIAAAMDFVSYDMIVAPIAVITNGIIGNRLILGAAGGAACNSAEIVCCHGQKAPAADGSGADVDPAFEQR